MTPPNNSPRFDTILVTGTAGFIGFHLARRLCLENPDVTIHGLDNVNDYYDVTIKNDRLAILAELPNFKFHKLGLEDRAGMADVFSAIKPDIVIHLAAQAGVRYSLENPHAYITSNIDGFVNILEGCRHNHIQHLIYASSSSVYGANTKLPYSVDDNVDHPISLYAATKKSNELMAHVYAHLYGLPCTGLRFFTVYGPWGRPDMAMFKFTKALYKNRPIDVYNNGNMKRDFTYIDDIIEGIVRLIPVIPARTAKAPCALYNIGNNQPEDLMEMISILEQETGLKAQKNLLPPNPGDMLSTYADIDELTAATGFKPYTPLKTGIRNFVRWYREYYKIGNSLPN